LRPSGRALLREVGYAPGLPSLQLVSVGDFNSPLTLNALLAIIQVLRYY